MHVIDPHVIIDLNVNHSYLIAQNLQFCVQLSNSLLCPGASIHAYKRSGCCLGGRFGHI